MIAEYYTDSEVATSAPWAICWGDIFGIIENRVCILRNYTIRKTFACL